MHTHYRPLRLNVGFLLSQSAGYGRQFDFREEKLNLGADLQVENFLGRAQLTRTPQGIVVQGDFSAQLSAECARCLNPFTAPISIQFEDLFVYPPQNATDPLLAVAEDAHLTLEPLVREYVLVNQPTRPLCRPDCKGLCPICGNDLNEGECQHPEEEKALLIPERMLIRTAEKKEKSAAGKEKKSPPARRKKAPSGKKKQRAKKTTAKTPRKKATGGKKTSARKKTTGGRKKKTTKK